MSVRITDILKDPLGNPCPNTVIRVTTTQGAGTVLETAVEDYLTDAEGVYDFVLEEGIHQFEIVWTNTLECIGHGLVNAGTPSPITINDLLAYVPIDPTPPPLSDNPQWDDLYDDVMCSPDSVGNTVCDTYSAGRAISSTVHKTYCNARFGSKYAEQTDSTCTSLTEISKHQIQTYTDVCGSKSAYNTSSAEILGSKGERTISLISDGVGNVCSCKLDTLITPTFEDTCEVTVTGEVGSVIHETGGGKNIKYVGTVYDDTGIVSCTVNKTEATKETYSQEATCEYIDNFVLVNKPRIWEEAISCLDDFSILTHCSDLKIKENDEYLYECCTSNTVLSEHSYDRVFNNGFLSMCQIATDCFEVGNVRDCCFVPMFQLDACTDHITFYGDVTFTDNTCCQLQGPPGSSQYTEIEYAPTPAGPWESTLKDTDIWQRYRLVTVSGVTGTPTYGDWVGPINLRAEDGHPGDTLYFEYEYSIDGLTDWHPTLIPGDKFRRERIVYNSEAGEWSTPARIVGDDGEPGSGITVVYDYSINALLPDPLWHPNFSAGDYWRRERYYRLVGDTPEAEPFNVVIVKIIPEKGVDYNDGLDGYAVRLVSTDQIFTYNTVGLLPSPANAVFTAEVSEAVSAKSSNLLYVFKKNDIIVQQSGLNTYTYVPPTDVTGMPELISVEVVDTSDNNKILASDQMSVYGLQNGSDAITVILSNEAHTFPAENDGTVISYVGGGTNIQVFLGATALRYGTYKNEYIVTTSPSGISPNPNPTTSGGTVRVYGEPSNMTTNPAAINFNIIINHADAGELTITKKQSFAKSIKGGSGVDGDPGAGYYGFEGVMPSTTSGKTNCFISEVGRNPVSGDTFVAYSSTSSYVCAVQYNRIANSWVTPKTLIDGSLVVTGTIGAKQIAANSISGEKIQANTRLLVGPAKVGNDIVILDGTDPNWRIWAGHSCVFNAPFRVDKYGHVHACNATVCGTIYASSGVFSGTVSAATVCGSTIIGGTICGANGYFSGTICADNIQGDITSLASLCTTFKSVNVPNQGTCYLNMFKVVVNYATNKSAYVQIPIPHEDYERDLANARVTKHTEYCVAGGSWTPVSSVTGLNLHVPSGATREVSIRYKVYGGGTFGSYDFCFSPENVLVMLIPTGSRVSAANL